MKWDRNHISLFPQILISKCPTPFTKKLCNITFAKTQAFMSYVYVDFPASLFCSTDLLTYSCANNHIQLNYWRFISLANLIVQLLPSFLFPLLSSLFLTHYNCKYNFKLPLANQWKQSVLRSTPVKPYTVTLRTCQNLDHGILINGLSVTSTGNDKESQKVNALLADVVRQKLSFLQHFKKYTR